MPSAYRIIDEPRASPAAHLAVDPMWCLLATMLCGGWLAWPWFLFNGYAIGSATQRKEIAIVVAGIIGSIALFMATIYIALAVGLGQSMIRGVALLSATIVKLGCGYWLCLIQGRSFAIFRYYGGGTKNPILPLLAGTFARTTILEHIPPLLLAAFL